jgi:hypothetical protein
MSIVLPVSGSLNWDIPLNLALGTLGNSGMNPNDHGWKLWTNDPLSCGASDAHTSGSVRMIKLPSAPQSYTLTSVKFFVAAVAVTPTAGQNFAGIYDASGTRLAVSADVTADLTATGMKTWAMTAPIVVAANTPLWVALLFNAATAPTGVASAAVSGRETLYNGDLTVATARYTSGPTAQTSLPVSITMASRTLLPRSPWIAVT